MDSDAGAIPETAGFFERGGGRGAWRTARPRNPVRQRRGRALSGWIVMGATVLMVADGAASLLLPRPGAAPDPIAAPSPAPTTDWVDIPGPLHLYGLTGSPYARLPLLYQARRRGTGGERQDVLSYGAFDGPAPFLRLTAHRWAGPAEPPPDLLVDLARLAAADGLAVTRIGLPLNLMTRFGLFDTADITLRRGAAAEPCLGFRLAGVPDAPVALAGLACGSDAKPIDRGVLGCVLSRIDLLSAGDDRALRDFFVAAERRRNDECAHVRGRGPEMP